MNVPAEQAELAFAGVPAAIAPSLPDTPLPDLPSVPYDELTEQALLGACLADPDATSSILARLVRTDFHKIAHQRIFDAIQAVASRSVATDATVVNFELVTGGHSAATGGAPYLIELQSAAPLRPQLDAYMTILQELSAQRALRQALLDAITDLNGRQAAHAVASRIRGQLDRLPHPASSRIQALPALMVPVLDDLDHRSRPQPGPSTGSRIMTGYTDVDDRTGGLRPGQLVIVAGATGMGKSVVAGDIARSAALRQGKRVLFLALEMSASELVYRFIAAEAKIDHRTLADRPETLTDDEWKRIAQCYNAWDSSRLWIDDTAGTSLADIRAKAVQTQQTHGLDLLVVDHLGLVTGAGHRSRNDLVGEISSGLKTLAKDLGIVSLALSQLNRDHKNRLDKHPVLPDLRDSGNVEQDADLVLGLHRDDYENPESPRSGEMDIEILKNRSGGTGRCTVAWQGRFCRAVDMYQPPSALFDAR